MTTRRRSTRLLLPATVLCAGVLFVGAGIDGGAGKGKRISYPGLQKTQALDAYLFWINNIIMPISSNGTFADVLVNGVGVGAYQNPSNNFLFSGGFFLSGYTNGTLWANGVASASRVVDYKPGRTRSSSNDKPGIYVVDKGDPPFGPSWLAWSDAVAMGADYWDGDRNGAYNPVDLNGNGSWDTNEDSPDILGDQTAWFVIADQEDPTRRRWVGQQPQGIDIQHSVFGFRSSGSIGNILFVRYRIINRGTVADRIDSVIFSLWADADLGEYLDDLVGCDRSINAGYTWNDGPDGVFGTEAPVFAISFFQGPIVQTGNTADTALNVRGQIFGVEKIPGARNLGLASFVNYVQSDALRGDPATATEARNYQRGRLKAGAELNPCADPYGSVFAPVQCDTVDKRFWYSGDPVANTGWLYTVPGDMRQMQNVGPFTLERDQPVDIVAAYVVARGTDARNSVALGRTISTLSKRVYDSNFEGPPPMPAVQPIIRTTDNSIELVWETPRQMGYRATSPTFGYDLRFEAYEVWAFNRNSTAAKEDGQENARIIARYDLANAYGDIIVDNPDGTRSYLLRKGTQLDSASLNNPLTGRIRFSLTTDPWTGTPIVKGKPYFLSVIAHAIDVNNISPLGTSHIVPGSGYLSGALSIFNGTNGGIRPGFDYNLTPYRLNEAATQTAGISEGRVTVDEVRKQSLTGNTYEVRFFRDPTVNYGMIWRLVNTSTGATLLDSIKDTYRPVPGDEPAYNLPVVDGFLVRVAGVNPEVKTPVYTHTQTNTWYRPFSVDDGTGVFYLGGDLTVTGRPSEFSGANTTPSYDQLRRIEIRFGPTQKAYRYIKQQPPPFGDPQRYIYAAAQTTADASRPNYRVGFVDVPFQVWVRDTRTNEEYQLNCGVMENRFRQPPDGLWDPGVKIGGSDTEGSKEYILIYPTRYSPDTLIQYTGGVFPGGTRWATVLNGWTLPPADTALLTPEQRRIAGDKYMGALYAVGFQRRDTTRIYQAGEILSIPISYPFKPQDVYRFTTSPGGVNYTDEDRKQLFDRVNVYPNPMFAYNPINTALGGRADEPFVTFTNLPPAVTVKIFTLAGVIVRTLTEQDKSLGINSPFLEWDLENEDGLRVASGMYLAIVSSPGIGEKVLKLAVIMPQKQIDRF